MTNRTNLVLQDHAEQTHADARAVESHINKLLSWPYWPIVIEDIKAHHIHRWIADQKDLSPSTIGTRLSVLKQAMARAGVAFPYGVKMPPRSKRPKWIITQEQQESAIAFLLGGMDRGVLGPERTMVDYILLVTETGLRVEEALRVRVTDMLKIKEDYFLEVHGTKNASSYDIIPLSKVAADVLLRRSCFVADSEPLFGLRYETMKEAWDACRTHLGVTDKTATLKSLRRTFASRMAAKGCPAPILQKLMRHGSLATTSHYTNTIGMHEAARQWVA